MNTIYKDKKRISSGSDNGGIDDSGDKEGDHTHKPSVNIFIDIVL